MTKFPTYPKKKKYYEMTKPSMIFDISFDQQLAKLMTWSLVNIQDGQLSFYFLFGKLIFTTRGMRQAKQSKRFSSVFWVIPRS